VRLQPFRREDEAWHAERNGHGHRPERMESQREPHGGSHTRHAEQVQPAHAQHLRAHQVFPAHVETHHEEEKGHAQFTDVRHDRPFLHADRSEPHPGHQIPHERRQTQQPHPRPGGKSNDDPSDVQQRLGSHRRCRL
jgi:hypothetical protein